MKIVSFNANGIRTRLHQIEAIIERHDPTIIGLQETKVADTDFPFAELRMLGYQAHAYGQKTNYGVALLSRTPALRVARGLPNDDDDAQRRLIDASYASPSGPPLRVICGYFPQGEKRAHPIKFPAKAQFYADVLDYLRASASPDERLVLLGDFNVAPLERDIGIGADNAARWLRTGKTGFLPEERAWMAALLAWGLCDAWRQVHPEVDDRFSWFDYRSRGFEREPKRGLRIDHVLVSRTLVPLVVDAGIDYDVRAMRKPSDHCPAWVALAL